MTIRVFQSQEEIGKAVSEKIAEQIAKKYHSVLGFATGSSPLPVYRELVSMYREGKIDFSGITSFNLDEYYPVSPENPQSYRYFMEKHLFSLVNIPRENIHIPNGLAEDPEKECEEYDKALKRAGYPDLQLLGIGRNGHIGFNEPGAFLLCNTHQTRLAPSTVDANARFFSSASDVPQTALTMGVGAIMKSKTVILIAVGKEKKEAVSALMKNRITPDIPATILLAHPDFHLFCDKDAYPSENNN